MWGIRAVQYSTLTVQQYLALENTVSNEGTAYFGSVTPIQYARLYATWLELVSIQCSHVAAAAVSQPLSAEFEFRFSIFKIL